MNIRSPDWTTAQDDSFLQFTLAHYPDYLHIRSDNGELLSASFIHPPTSFFHPLSLRVGLSESDLHEHFNQRTFLLCQFILSWRFLDQKKSVERCLQSIREQIHPSEKPSRKLPSPNCLASTTKKSTRLPKDGDIFHSEQSAPQQLEPLKLPSLSNFSHRTPSFSPKPRRQGRKIQKLTPKSTGPTSPLAKLEGCINDAPELQEAFRPYISHLKCSLILIH